MMARHLLIVLASVVAPACSSTTTGSGPGGGGGGSDHVASASGGGPGSGGAPGTTTGDGGADGGAPPTASGGDGGSIPVGECVSEVSVAGGMCQTEYACDRGRVTVRCGEGDEGAAPCECLVDGVVVATCETTTEGQADTEQCWFPDNCCREALGAG